ncbi:zf-HC2 domain-containing protein [Desulfosarcina sp.]|uniref:zf-HC2 domain-containing protein n=1 Tax=Desulfosarcina sp. TaxID=2027861 RepID=UPI0039710C63
MNDPHSSACDEILLGRYLDGDLVGAEKEQIEAHLGMCRQCRRHVAAMDAFSRNFRDRVQQVTESVDYVTLEKQVLNKALRQYRSQSGFWGFIPALKYTLPAAVTLGMLIFFAYSHYMVDPRPAPSAIINSFTGSISSVMIFETPERRETILWYQEDQTLESEPDAV